MAQYQITVDSIGFESISSGSGHGTTAIRAK
jgi:hypothetical protein